MRCPRIPRPSFSSTLLSSQHSFRLFWFIRSYDVPKAKDERMKLVDELLQNIRFLKFYGWGQWTPAQHDFNDTHSMHIRV